MIKVNKDYSLVPDKLKSIKCQSLVVKSITEKNGHEFKASYYNKGTLELLIKLYNNKCCYCETKTASSAFWRVDHYRPKSRVKEDNTHLGYYWLAYEWSNLLLSCEKCNNHKLDHFPIENEISRIRSPKIIKSGIPHNFYLKANSKLFRDEKSLLLNPEIDNPEDHIYFKPDGTVSYISPKGKKSIEIYGLDREDLNLARHKIIDDYFDEIKKILSDYIKDIIDEETLKYSITRWFKYLLKNQNKKLEYSRVWHFIFHKFPVFSYSYLKGQHFLLVDNLYQNFIYSLSRQKVKY